MYYEPDTVWGRTIEGDEEVTVPRSGLSIVQRRVLRELAQAPEADRAAFPIGNWPARKWLATGDQGFITGGQVVITGRDSERVIMSGKLYYAHDIETVAAHSTARPQCR